MFSFVLYDKNKDRILAARDHVGITTLYKGTRYSDNSIWFASELKALHEDCDVIETFPPGHLYDSSKKNHELVEYYHPKWYDDQKNEIPKDSDSNTKMSPEEENEMYRLIRETLEKSVQKRLMSDVPYGVLLSGGLDSSLIAAIASRFTEGENLQPPPNMLLSSDPDLAGKKKNPFFFSFFF